MEEKDPIKRLRQYLTDNNILSAGEIEAIESDTYNQVEEAARFALESSEPDPAGVLEDVFFEHEDNR